MQVSCPAKRLVFGNTALYTGNNKKQQSKSGETAMSRLSMGVSFVCLAAVACLATAGPSAAQQAGAALSGTVTAGPEALEGVLVSAKKSGSTITTTVVSGKDGHYSFPAGRLEPGAYSLRIRAVGYDLDGPSEVSLASDK